MYDTNCIQMRHFCLSSEMANVNKYISGRIVGIERNLSLTSSSKITDWWTYVRIVLHKTIFSYSTPQNNSSWDTDGPSGVVQANSANAREWCVHQRKVEIILASWEMITGVWHWRFSERPESNIFLFTMNDRVLYSTVTLNSLVP